MRLIISLFAIVAAVCLFASCKKCQTCEVRDGAAIFISPATECGSKKDLEKQKNNCITSANNFASAECTCTED